MTVWTASPREGDIFSGHSERAMQTRRENGLAKGVMAEDKSNSPPCVLLGLGERVARRKGLEAAGAFVGHRDQRT